MFDEIDRIYYRRRAAEERARAAEAREPGIALTHRAMAAEYERRLAALPIATPSFPESCAES